MAELLRDEQFGVDKVFLRLCGRRRNAPASSVPTPTVAPHQDGDARASASAAVAEALPPSPIHAPTEVHHHDGVGPVPLYGPLVEGWPGAAGWSAVWRDAAAPMASIDTSLLPVSLPSH
jgi:hypothetical protein